MIRRYAMGIVSLSLVASGCTEPTPTAPPATYTPNPEIVDAAHEGRDGIYFLPPLVPNPQYLGAFDESLLPFVLVSICALQEDTCGETVAEYTATGGTDGETVSMDAADEQYHVNFHTDKFTLDPTGTYRITVMVAGTSLGHIDVQVVESGKGLKNVDTSEYVALKDGRTLPIKFRLEHGAVFVATPDGSVLSDPSGSLSVTVPAGAVTNPIGLTIDEIVVDDPDAGVLGGRAWLLGPEGTLFLEPIQVAIAYDPALIPEELLTEMVIGKTEGDDFVELETWHDVDGQRLVGLSTSLSVWTLLPGIRQLFLTPDVLPLEIGASTRVGVSMRDSRGRPVGQICFWNLCWGRRLRWTSLDPTIATVVRKPRTDEHGIRREGGRVTGVTGGMTSVRVASRQERCRWLAFDLPCVPRQQGFLPVGVDLGLIRARFCANDCADPNLVGSMLVVRDDVGIHADAVALVSVSPNQMETRADLFVPAGTHFASVTNSPAGLIPHFSTCSVTPSVPCRFPTLDVQVDVGQSHQLIVEHAQAEGSVSGTVTDADGNPIADMQVEATRADEDFFATPLTVWTDDNGHYRIPSFADQYEVRIPSPPVDVVSVPERHVIIVAPGDEAMDLDFALRPSLVDISRTQTSVPDGTVGLTTTIEIRLFDGSDGPVTGEASNLSVTVAGVNTAAPIVLETAVPGTYEASYVPASAGGDLVTVTYDGAGVPGSPFTTGVGGVDVSRTETDVPDGIVGFATAIVIRLFDGQGVPVGGEAGNLGIEVSGVNAVTPTPIETGSPGVYEASYVPNAAGQDLVTITYDGSGVPGSPFSTSVGQPIDTDGDGVPDGVDVCPLDPADLCAFTTSSGDVIRLVIETDLLRVDEIQTVRIEGTGQVPAWRLDKVRGCGTPVRFVNSNDFERQVVGNCSNAPPSTALGTSRLTVDLDEGGTVSAIITVVQVVYQGTFNEVVGGVSRDCDITWTLSSNPGTRGTTSGFQSLANCVKTGSGDFRNHSRVAFRPADPTNIILSGNALECLGSVGIGVGTINGTILCAGNHSITVGLQRTQ